MDPFVSRQRSPPKRPLSMKKPQRHSDLIFGFLSDRARLAPYSSTQSLPSLSPSFKPHSKQQEVASRHKKKREGKEKSRAIETEPAGGVSHRPKSREKGVVNPRYWEECETFEYEHKAMRALYEKMMREKEAEIERLEQEKGEWKKASAQENEKLKREVQTLREQLEEAKQRLGRKRTEKNDFETLKRENERISQELTEAKDTIKRFLCPKEITEITADRDANSLFPSLWSHLLRNNPSGIKQNLKSELLQSIQSSGMITHRSIQIGLNQLAFPVTHCESLALMSVISPDSDPEESKATPEEILQVIVMWQPYVLWEDISDTLQGYKVKFAADSVSPEALKEYISENGEELTKPYLVKLLSEKHFVGEPRAEDLSNFALRGQTSLTAAAIYENLIAALGSWRCFSEFKHHSQQLLTRIVTKDLRLARRLKDLSKTENVIPLAEFLSKLLVAGHAVDEEFELFIQCVSYKRAPISFVSIADILACANEAKSAAKRKESSSSSSSSSSSNSSSSH